MLWRPQLATKPYSTTQVAHVRTVGVPPHTLKVRVFEACGLLMSEKARIPYSTQPLLFRHASREAAQGEGTPSCVHHNIRDNNNNLTATKTS
jgi:hypothetical protein